MPAPRSADDEVFELRLARSAPDLFPMLEALYGARSDYPAFRDRLLKALRKGWADRPEDLKRLDLQRDLEPDWFQRPDMAGYVFYIDRFNGSFRRELLDAHLFRSLAHVRQLVDEWRYDYNTQRPHQALNFMTPLEFKQTA